MTYLAVSCRVLLGTVFLMSSGTKIAGRSGFQAYARALRRLGFFRPALIPAVAVTVLTSEIAVVAQLAAPATTVVMAGFALAIALLAVFSLAIARSLNLGDREPCRCFGTSRVRLGWRHVVRNAVLAGFALLGMSGMTASGGLRPAGYAAAVLTGFAMGLTITRADQYAELFRTPESSASRRLPRSGESR